MNMMNFSALLKKFRAKSGLSKAELARKIGLASGNYFVNIESGNKRAPTLERCRQIAGALHLSKEEADELIQSAAEERMKGEELTFMRESMKRSPINPFKSDAQKQALETKEKFYSWDLIRGKSCCPHCQKEIEVEIKPSGEIEIYGRVSEKVRRTDL